MSFSYKFKRRTFPLVLASTIAFTSCGNRQQSDSEFEYRVAPKAYAGLLRKVHQTSIKVCMANDPQTEAHKADVVHSIVEWTGALVGFTNDTVTQNVEFTAANDPTCDTLVAVGSYNPAHTYMGNKPRVNINYNGWFGSRTVTLHEFGHAFGLYDTYAGSGGSCQSGQPNSVMCRASYEHLTQDDIDGLRVAYTNARQRNFAPDDDTQIVVVE